MVAYHANGEFEKALSTAIDFRKQLGLSTLNNKPLNTLIIIKEFIKTKRALGKRTAEDISNLPELTDERIIMGQRMLELSASASFAVSRTYWRRMYSCGIDKPDSYISRLLIGTTNTTSFDHLRLGQDNN